jgi:hypothetical protein
MNVFNAKKMIPSKRALDATGPRLIVDGVLKGEVKRKKRTKR